jgi:hypothetical protein
MRRKEWSMSLFARTLIAAHAAVFALGLTSNPAARAADSDTAAEKATVMTVRGKVLFRDALSEPLGSGWVTAKGKWEVVNGAIQGTEVPSDQHAAAARHPLKFRNAVIQYSFKLDGAKATSLSLNDAKGHVCRVVITPQDVSVRKDDHDKTGPDKAALIQLRKVAIEPGRWHTLLVEMQGPEMLARIDDETVAFGSNAGVDVEKTNFGLIVSGASVSLKNLMIWEAEPNAGWAATRAKLASSR